MNSDCLIVNGYNQNFLGCISIPGYFFRRMVLSNKEVGRYRRRFSDPKVDAALTYRQA